MKEMIVSKSGKIIQGDNYLYYPGLTELLQLPCPELLHCDSLYRLASPAQAQQPTLSEVTFQPLDLVLTLTPEPTRRLTYSPAADDSSSQTPWGDSSCPESVQALQPTLTEVTCQTLDLKLTLPPEPTLEVEAIGLEQTTAPPKLLKVTFALPEPV